MKNHLDRLSYEQIIEDLAAFYGIESEYKDNWGRVQRTSAKTKENILKAIGVNVDTKAMANDRWHARGEGEWSRMTEPAIVATLSSLPNKLMFQVPVNADSASSPTQDLEVSLEVADEHGIVRQVAFTSKELSFCDSRRIGGRIYERWSLPFPPLGTHGYYTFHLCVLTAGQQREQTILAAICPDKAYIPPALEGGRRSAGIAISLYGVRSNKNWGIGDLGDLKQIVDWVADDLHGGVIGVNPLHATFNRRPFNTSPYLPMSRFYRNFIYLDIPVMEDYRDSPEAKALVHAPETQRLLRDLRASETVAYERVGALKQEVLREVFQFFLKNHWKRPGGKTDRQNALENYIEREGIMLDNFATFCALDSAMRSRDPEVWTWSQWPPEYRRPDTKAVERFREEQWREVLFHKYVQWQLEEQLAEVQGYAGMRGMGIGLYHDLALAIDRFSADF
ncbi:MAG TPA: hypothetical protein EYP19_01465, partial [Desulfobacterales bacterium]|nr:hypothetical protein [Desulfobacterales bacterium]